MSKPLRRVGLTIAAVTMLLLPGCLSDGVDSDGGVPTSKTVPARPIVGLAEMVTFEAKADDGTALRGVVYIPEGEGPFPTVLIYSPYWGNARAVGERLIRDVGDRKTVAGILGNFTDHGYAVAAVNIRGTGVSDGCFSYINPIDGPDSAAVIAQIAKEPWSDGQVAMFGGSYEAWTQYNAMIYAGPELKAVAPTSGTIDQWKLFTRAGVAIKGAAFHHILRDVAQGLGTDGIVTTAGPKTNPSLPPPSTVYHWCEQTATDVNSYYEAVRTGDKDAFFAERDIMEELNASTVPALASFGLTQDEGHILQSEGIWPLLPEGSRLLLGQWGHAYPVLDDRAYIGLVLDWFDQHMRGAPPVEAGFVDYQDDAMNWHRTPVWPPVATEVPLFLSADALASDPAAVAESAKTFQGPPDTPDGTDCGDRLVRYVSEPLLQDVTLAGNFVVELAVSSGLPDGNVAAYLYRVSGSGACDEGEAIEIRRALGDLYHRGYLEVGQNFPTDKADKIVLKSVPFASVIPAGHRIVLAIGGGSSELLPAAAQPAITVHTGGEAGSILKLPVVKGEVRFSGSQPVTPATASPLTAATSVLPEVR